MPSNTWDLQRLELQKLIRKMRKESNLTQQELSLLLSKPQSYVSKYESGERRLDVIELRDICIICNSSFKEFSEELDKTLITLK